MSRFRTGRAVIVLLAMLVGIMLGVGGYTFIYAEGLSYFSNDPKTCVNCHIMNDQYQSWGAASHHHVAVCNDCHLPHEFVSKMVAKTRNGWNHSVAFTLQNFHEPIMITPKNAEILNANCVHCHGEFVHDAILVRQEDQPGQGLMCVHCHRGVGHGPTR